LIKKGAWQMPESSLGLTLLFMAFFLSFLPSYFLTFPQYGLFLLTSLSINTTYELFDEAFSIVILHRLAENK
jgi:hypothetical protein